MEFPPPRTVFGSACYSLSILSVIVVISGCDTTSPTTVTDINVQFDLTDSTAGADSIAWSIAGKSGGVAVSRSERSYAFKVHLEKRVAKDSLKIELRTLSVTTYRLAGMAGQEKPSPVIDGKWPDPIANRMVKQFDSAVIAAGTRYSWSRNGLHAFYADLLLSGSPGVVGYPGNAPTGIDTAYLDSVLLRKVVDSKDSVAQVAKKWAVGWTAEELKPVFRKWLAAGSIRQGQYDTLYPFDDRPPTLARALVFTGAKDSNGLQRGSTGVQVEGRFLDDTGIVSQKIRVFAKNGDDVTQKFTIAANDFPSQPQKEWDLAGKFALKTEFAPTDLYTLQMDFADRKNQILTAKLAFYVYPLGGVMIDSLAPNIVPANPSSRVDTVVDTTRSYQVRFAVSDQNLKTVVFDKADTAKVEDGVVSKTIPLEEGRESVVRIWAVDSAGNKSTDSVRIFRRAAVRPVATWNHPATGRDSVPDTTYTYPFRWKVEGQDVDSILIDGQPVLLDNQKIAERVLPLVLGGRTTAKIRVVDKLRHAFEDSMVVARGASVAPLVLRVGVPAGLVTVPDTQSYFAASWTVSDNDLDTLRLLGKDTSLSDGKCGTTVFLKAGDTARIAVWAKDKLGSVGTDTIKVWRPDPRAPYLSDIQKVQRGDSVVPLTDFVLPNVRFGRFEVTADLYAKVMRLPAPQTPGLPVANVSIYDAMLFCNAMSKAAGLDTFYTYTSRVASSGYLNDFAVRSDTVDPAAATKVIRKGIRLPSAVEWDLAASAWSTVHPWGGSENSQVVAQYAVWNTLEPAMAGTRQPTGLGLFDLVGNVAEWTCRNRGMLDELTNWQVEGGSYQDVSAANFSTSVQWMTGTSVSRSIGFRIVRTGQN